MSAQTKIRKGTFQHIESELFAYHETRQAIVRLKNEILYGKPQFENTGGGRSNLPGDPTGTTATLLVTHRRLEEMQKMVQAIEAVYERLPDQKKELVVVRYWTRPQTLTWDGIALQLHVSRRTAMNWRDEIVYAIAEKLGWI